jgi:HEAT repeat protein
MKGLGEAIDIGLRFAGALETPGDVAERLCERASKDPSMDARVMCLSKLLERFPDGPATRRALEYARGPDASVQMRLVAGRALGDVGLLAKAANSLLETREAADASTIEAASAALELLGRRYPHAPEAEGALRGWLDSGAARDPRSKRALVEALGDIHHPEAGRHLLDALSSHEGEAIQCAAMASLGRVGTLEAVPHLLPYRDKMFSVVLKAAARDAIQKIQLRSRSAPGGSLSLATDEVGALAIVRDKLP